MSKECFIYCNFLFFIISIISSLAFENRYSTYELDFSSEKQEFLVNTNSKFNFFFKDAAWIYIKNAKNNAFIKLLAESYQDGAMFTFQTSRNVGIIMLTFRYQNVKDSREFTKNVILKITKGEGFSKLDEIKPEDNLDLDKGIQTDKSDNNSSLRDIMRRALNLSYINDYKGAIELLNRYDFNDDEYILLKAELYYKSGDYLNSYLNYLSLRDRYFNKIFLSLINLGIKLNKVENVLKDVKFLVENNVAFGEDIYLDILEFLLMNREYEFFLNLSLLYYPKYLNSRFPDRYNYLLGKLYESESKYKDFVKSLSCYKRVIDSYPFSSYYELSKLRYLFLKRFF
ncbi:hypothetical protein [Borrelia hermsii]|uniref:Tetratricopeptide repeat family protein n=3 Tax=Borrelia hermsii TaxID=140 RepID=A0AAN0X640_BORHE|nr:hypothetical protein [Borrelia hermsii]AAX16567.1 hypothetical protein BH0043 [Borrelia hermsii DAH]AJW72879.1 hypothetical protein L283_00210 [Borrelia hermsii CC1]AMR75765.1 hypothetical protein A0V01_04115 [Borrelia hermsii]ANA42867.1 hypothetical protein AXX13_00210 [Borrelia hermsii HS1]UCP01085.1 hypothetical protein K9R62_00215 [Borrelia hermsii]